MPNILVNLFAGCWVLPDDRIAVAMKEFYHCTKHFLIPSRNRILERASDAAVGEFVFWSGFRLAAFLLKFKNR